MIVLVIGGMVQPTPAFSLLYAWPIFLFGVDHFAAWSAAIGLVSQQQSATPRADSIEANAFVLLFWGGKTWPEEYLRIDSFSLILAMAGDPQKYLIFLVSALLLSPDLVHEDVALDAGDLMLRVEPMTEHLFNIKNYRIAKNAQKSNPTQKPNFSYQTYRSKVGSAVLMTIP